MGNIIYKNCATCHHPGAIGYQQTFLDFTNELSAYNSRSSIANVVSNQSMPPWMPDPNYKHFASERVLTAAEIADIQTWAANSTYQNATPPNPTPPTFPTGFTLPSSSTATFDLAHSPYTVAENQSSDEYRNFAFTNTFSQTIYITKIEFLIPQTGAQVHHIALFKDQSGTHQSISNQGGNNGYTFNNSPGSIGNFSNSFVYSWVPGSGVFNMPCNFGLKLNPNENLVAQFHYPIYDNGGTALADASQIRIQYTTATTTREAFASVIIGGGNSSDWFTDATGSNLTQNEQTGLAIAANSIITKYRNVPVSAVNTISNSAISVIGVSPHMHLRGKAVEIYGAPTINGTKSNLVKINNWQLHWQETYIFQQPVKLNYTDKVFMTSTFDNTSANAELPPNAWNNAVTQGLSTSDEMMVTILLWCPYDASDESMVLDPELPNALKADAGGPFSPHACSVTTIGGINTGTGGVAPLSYAWSTANGMFASGTNIANPSIYQQAQPSSYSVTVTDSKLCSATASAAVSSTGTGFLKILNGNIGPEGVGDMRTRVLGDVSVDNMNYVYGIGYYKKDVFLDRPNPYLSTNNAGIFYVKYNPDDCGSLLWSANKLLFGFETTVKFGAQLNGHPYSGNVAIDNANNLYSSIHGKLTSTNPTQLFITKHNATGIEIWNASYSKLFITDMEADVNGDVYIAGYCDSASVGIICPISIPKTGGGNYILCSSEMFIAKVNKTATSFTLDWLTKPGWAVTDGLPSIKLESDQNNGLNSLFINTNKYLGMYDPANGTIRCTTATTLPAKPNTRFIVNGGNGVRKIITLDGATLRTFNYSYSGSTASISPTILNATALTNCMDIAGNKNAPYYYVVTETGLSYRNFGNNAQTFNLPYISTGTSKADKVVAMNLNTNKIYVGGSFPQSQTPNITVNDFSFSDMYGGSFLTRASANAAIYAKTDVTTDNESSVPPIEIEHKESYLDVYPIPSSSEIEIHTNYPSGSLVKVYNLLGSCIDKLYIDGVSVTYKLNIVDYPSGSYYIQLSSDKELVNKRFLRE